MGKKTRFYLTITVILICGFIGAFGARSTDETDNLVHLGVINQPTTFLRLSDLFVFVISGSIGGLILSPLIKSGHKG